MTIVETTEEYMARKGLKKGAIIGDAAEPGVVMEAHADYLARKAAGAKNAGAKSAAKKAGD